MVPEISSRTDRQTHRVTDTQTDPETDIVIKYFATAPADELITVFNGNWTTCGYANSRIANSRTSQLANADWSTRGCRHQQSRL